MYKELIKIDTPKVFFKHELEQLGKEYLDHCCSGYVPKYFTFLDENGKLADKVLYEPYNDLNNTNYYGDKLCVMKRCEEERYSQSTINSCRKNHKKYGTKQYEWYLITKPAVINVVTGECVFVAKHEMDYVCLYDNLIYYKGYYADGGKQILNWLGDVIVNHIQEMFDTKTHLIVKIDHDYSTNLDNVICINKLTGNIDNKY